MQIYSGVELVAVKKLNYVQHDIEKEFMTELKALGQTHRKNLIHLFGYFDEGQHSLLVYEFLSNGPLASFVFADVKPSWRQRIEIAHGVARNSDFGLAILTMNQHQIHTAIRGTKGYVATEWFHMLPITTKVDVCSFGVVLLEIIFCKRSVDVENNCKEKANFRDWVYNCYVNGELHVVVDYEPRTFLERWKLQIFVTAAFWCIQEDPSLRPTMRKVVQMLEGKVEVHVPPYPFPYTRTG
ncbi:hypothetical protein TB2_028400 [Malus domestica]